MVVLSILGVLFLALIILVPLLEKFSSGEPSLAVQKMSKYIFPIIALMFIIQICMYYFKG